jgi:hypothetical protein
MGGSLSKNGIPTRGILRKIRKETFSGFIMKAVALRAIRQKLGVRDIGVANAKLRPNIRGDKKRV